MGADPRHFCDGGAGVTTPVAPRTPGFPERAPASQGNPHLYEWMGKVERWMPRVGAVLQALIDGLGDGTIIKNAASTFNFATATAPFYPTQDAIDPRKFKAAGTLYAPASVTAFFNGAKIYPPLLTVTNVGTDTIIQLDASLPAPTLTGGADTDRFWCEGAKA